MNKALQDINDCKDLKFLYYLVRKLPVYIKMVLRVSIIKIYDEVKE